MYDQAPSGGRPEHTVCLSHFHSLFSTRLSLIGIWKPVIPLIASVRISYAVRGRRTAVIVTVHTQLLWRHLHPLPDGQIGNQLTPVTWHQLTPVTWQMAILPFAM